MSNSVRPPVEIRRRLGTLTKYRGSAGSGLVRLLRIAGILVLIGGLQAFGFYRHFVPDIALANQNLDRLMDEAATHKLVEQALGELQDLGRVADNEALRTEAAQVYERFVKQFVDDPRMAINDFERVVSGFPVQSAPLGAEALQTLKDDIVLLRELYSDHYRKLVDGLASPPLYLQPTAVLIKRDDGFQQTVLFNHALYLSVVGDRSTANAIFNELKGAAGAPDLVAMIHYAQALMLYGAFQSEQKLEYYQQAVQNLKQSLRSNAGFGLPQLLLEYLLSVEMGTQTENYQVEGEGTGEAEGEQGVISTQLPTF